jgi:hypothetical protein
MNLLNSSAACNCCNEAASYPTMAGGGGFNPPTSAEELRRSYAAKSNSTISTVLPQIFRVFGTEVGRWSSHQACASIPPGASMFPLCALRRRRSIPTMAKEMRPLAKLAAIPRQRNCERQQRFVPAGPADEGEADGTVVD